ncbi:MAG: hypothetical protein WAU36_02490 [Cyclobacteriaceae bacterium]
MKKLLTRLLLHITVLSILLLSGYSQSYTNGFDQAIAHSTINIKDQTYTVFGDLKISQRLTFKSINSTSGKEKEHFKIDPAEIEEDELNSFSKYLTGSRHFTPIENNHPFGDLLKNASGNKYSTLFPSSEKYIAFQVFRI